MESSPLTLAHSHARNALTETRKSNPVAASEEHDLAAGEFATASQATVDPCALRTLRLLEKHHKQLAEILRFQHEHPPVNPQPESDTPNQTTDSPYSNPLPGPSISTSEFPQQPPRLSIQSRSHPRDTTSIASNLASARGIPPRQPRGSPASPTLTSQNARARMTGSPVKTRQKDGQNLEPQYADRPKRFWGPPTSPTEITTQHIITPNTNESVTAGLKSLAGDEPFRRFYSTFEGLISKLSAPLAFASLPLGVEQFHQRRASGNKSSMADAKLDRGAAAADFTNFSPKDPDVTKLVSSAALRAIKDKDKDSHFTPSNSAESFYVVPTAGGMISYAGILSRAEKEARNNSLHEDDDFVDANEDPPSPEVLQSSGRLKPRKHDGHNSLVSQGRGGDFRTSKTSEELQLENEALKHLSDTLAKRLHMWEVNAQSSSLALQQSIRAMHNQTAVSSPHQTSPTASANMTPMQTGPSGTELRHPSTAVTDAKIRELEETAKKSERKLEKINRENDKLKVVVEKYRERWEKLKEGARVRRETGNGGGTSNSPAPGGTENRKEDDKSPDLQE